MKCISYKRHRFNPDIFRRAIWLYFKFNLSFRDIEHLMAEWGILTLFEVARGTLRDSDFQRGKSFHFSIISIIDNDVKLRKDILMITEQLLRSITDEEIRTFEKDGIVCLRQMFSAGWVKKMREAAEVSMARPGELHAELSEERGDTGRFFHDTFIWQRNDTCRNFVFSSPAAQIARQLMRSQKINIFFDQWLIKEPGTSTKTPWHHDMTYWPIDGFQICTLWLALDKVSADNGAVEYIKGSHKWGQKFRPASFGDNNQYTENIPEIPDIEAERDKYDIAQFELLPGDCTVHHGLIVHAAPGNKTAALRRRAHTSRWAGDDVIFYPRDGLQEMPEFPSELVSGDPIDSELWPRIAG